MNACEELDRLLAGGDVEVLWLGRSVAEWRAMSRDDLAADVMRLTRELAEITRVLIAFHRQEGEGILAVKRLAKRLHEASVSQTDLSADGYFSPSAEPSSPEEAGP